jgi:hypothetical protein
VRRAAHEADAVRLCVILRLSAQLPLYCQPSSVFDGTGSSTTLYQMPPAE